MKVDRSSWPSGPWDNEPDHIGGEYLGVKWEMKRNQMGAWCGYVELPEGHAFLSQDDRGYFEASEWFPSAHGGISYSEGDIVGFDCAHLHDTWPSKHARGDGLGPEPGDVYRDADYVEQCCKWLCEEVLITMRGKKKRQGRKLSDIPCEDCGRMCAVGMSAWAKRCEACTEKIANAWGEVMEDGDGRSKSSQ